MPISFEFLRGVLGVLCLLFAYMSGRTLVEFRRGRARQSRFIAWMIRTLLCAMAMIFPRRAIDIVAIAVWILAAISFSLGVWVASRARKEEDLSKLIFPDEPQS